MDVENGNKDGMAPSRPGLKKPEELVGWLLLLVRLAALLATISATLLMGLNKETKNTVVAIVGTTPIVQAITAKFQHTPAFVCFVFANGIASAWSLMVLVIKSFLRCKNFDILVHLSDMVMLALVASGGGAAAFMAELGKNGNIHTMWSPVCDKFESFCHRGGWAIASSLLGVGLLVALNVLSTLNFYKQNV